MESPVKKIDFAGKENAPFNADAPVEVEVKVEVESLKKPVETKEVEKTVAKSAKELDAEEPLLQENPNRFVLFPIKYHEVSIFQSLSHIDAFQDA
jgi:ribonucleoside-diphosphate reductase subunit M2